jgi:uncharacterized membrane protein YraQ (UPF0718 family)
MSAGPSLAPRAAVSSAVCQREAFWKREGKIAVAIAGIFVGILLLPLGNVRFDGAVLEALYLAQWYAQEHVLLCLVPAFFIAGAISVFVGQASVLRYLGARANRVLAYGVASVSGSILAVCSCTVLPLFAGIYRRGAGLGPATAFLYSGPAVNVLAIVLTARLLGPELGVARAVGAVGFSIVIGLLMHGLFRGEELARENSRAMASEPETGRPLWQTGLYFGTMVGLLVAANWGAAGDAGLWATIHSAKWLLTAGFAIGVGASLATWFGARWWEVGAVAALVLVVAVLVPAEPVAPFAAGVVGLVLLTSGRPGELGEWFDASWQLARQILPLLLLGVLAAGLLLGRPGHEGLIPSAWVTRAVGGNSVGSNLFASVAGALMYFATLTEVPILQGLLGNGMGKGPALALLLAGPALSLPNMLVIRTVLGTRKSVTYVILVVVMASLSGVVFGRLVS